MQMLTLKNKQKQIGALQLSVLPVFISLQLSPEQSQELDKVLQQHGLELDSYKQNKCNFQNPGHITLAFFKEFESRQAYFAFIVNNYYEKKGLEQTVQVTGFVYNKKCVAFIVDVPLDLARYPAEKDMHITARLNGVPAFYSNKLIQNSRDGSDERDQGIFFMFSEPIEIRATVTFTGRLRSNAKFR